MSMKTQLLQKIERDDRTLNSKSDKGYAIKADLDIVIDSIHFHMNSDGSAVILRFDRLTDAARIVGKINSMLLRLFGPNFSLHDFLTKNGTTVYIRNRHFGFMGQRANKFFLGMSRVASTLLVGKEQ